MGFVQLPHGPAGMHVYAQPGIYTITIIDSGGCMANEYDTLVNLGISIDTTGYIQPTCSYSVMGHISTIVSGGTPPYTYQWNTGATTAAIDSLRGGDYAVSVTDNAGCLSKMHYHLNKLTDDPGYFVSLVWGAYPNCTNNGILTANVNNGKAPLYLFVE